MFGFFKKLLGLDKVDQKSEDPIVKLGPEPTEAAPSGFVAQEVSKVVPEAVVVAEEKPKVRAEVAASAEAAWPFPTAKPEESKKKSVKKPSAPKKKKPAAKSVPAISTQSKTKKKPKTSSK